MEIDAATAQFGKVSRYCPECCIEFHSHRDHTVARDQLGIPDPAVFVSVPVAIGINDAIIALDIADLGLTGKFLVRIRRQVLPPDIGESQIVEPRAVKDRYRQGAGAAFGELTLDC